MNRYPQWGRGGVTIRKLRTGDKLKLPPTLDEWIKTQPQTQTRGELGARYDREIMQPWREQKK